MENCLITTLKDSVNNNELLKLGEIKVKFTQDSPSALRVNPDINGSYYMRSINGCDIYSASGTISYGNYKEYSGTFEFSTKGAGTLFIYDNYLSQEFNIRGCTINVEQLQYRTKAIILKINDNIIQGDVTKLSTISRLRELYLNGGTSDAYDIGAFGASKKLQMFYNTPQAYGTVESLVEGQLDGEDARANGTLTLHTRNTNITFNGQKNTENKLFVVDFTDPTDVIVTFGGTQVAHYNGTWHYGS